MYSLAGAPRRACGRKGQKEHSWNGGTLHNAFDSRYPSFVVPQYLPQVQGISPSSDGEKPWPVAYSAGGDTICMSNANSPPSLRLHLPSPLHIHPHPPLPSALPTLHNNIGNRLFCFQTNRERTIDNKKIGRKKVSSGFALYVCLCICVYVCLCVCLSVGALQTSSFNIGGWNFDIDTYMWISQNGIFYFFKFLLIFGVIPLFHFLQFSLF